MRKHDDTNLLFPKTGDNLKSQPLAARMRPRNLDEFVGQAHIVGPGQLLRRAIEADRIQSLIFYGPPGTGKTSLAQIIAAQTQSAFEQLIAVESNIKEIRSLLDGAKTRLENKGESTIVFIDEIHRFNKTQQDALLPAAEGGVIKLIGATTENPSFSINGPLVSRSQVFELRPLTEDDMMGLLKRALSDSERGLGYLKVSADEDALRRQLTRCHESQNNIVEAGRFSRKAWRSLQMGRHLASDPGEAWRDGIRRTEMAGQSAQPCRGRTRRRDFHKNAAA